MVITATFVILALLGVWLLGDLMWIAAIYYALGGEFGQMVVVILLILAFEEEDND